MHLVTLVFALFLWAPAALTTLLYVPHYAEAHQDYTNNPQARLELFIAVMQSQDMHHLPEALGFPGHLPQALLKGIPIVFFPARYFSSIAANLSTGAEAATPSPCFRFP